MFHLGSMEKVSLSLVFIMTRIWFREPGTSLYRSHILNLSGQVSYLSSTIPKKNGPIIWPSLFLVVIAFDAHVLKWSLDDSPPDEYARHYIKEGSFYGTDTYSFDMIVKLPPSSASGSDESNHGILVNYIGLQEKAIWPAKKSVKAQGGFSMMLFEEFDTWLETKTGGTVDALLVGCVAGVMVLWEIYRTRTYLPQDLFRYILLLGDILI